MRWIFLYYSYWPRFSSDYFLIGGEMGMQVCIFISVERSVALLALWSATAAALHRVSLSQAYLFLAEGVRSPATTSLPTLTGDWDYYSLEELQVGKMLRCWVLSLSLVLVFSRPNKLSSPQDRRDRCTAIGIGPKAMVDGSTVTTHSKSSSSLLSKHALTPLCQLWMLMLNISLLRW